MCDMGRMRRQVDSGEEVELHSSKLAIYYFTLFEFYGISVSDRAQDIRNLKHWSARNVFLWFNRALTVIAMVLLIITTGKFAFLTTSSDTLHTTSHIKHHKSTVNLKFYYKLSFHFKSYFSCISYLYVLYQIDNIRNLFKNILVQLTNEQYYRRLIVTRRFLGFIWVINVFANAAFFVFIALDIDNTFLHEARNATIIKPHKPIPNEIKIVVVREVLWAIYGFGWFITTVLFMIWICYANYLVEKNVFERQCFERLFQPLMQDKILQGATTVTRVRLDGVWTEWSRGQLTRFYTVLRLLTALIEQINYRLGILPFFWLCELFLSTCLRITQVALLANLELNTLRHGKNRLLMQIEYHLEYFVEYFTLTAFYLSFIATVEFFASKRASLQELHSILLASVRYESKFVSVTLGGRRGEVDHLASSSLVLLTYQMAEKYSKSRFRAWCGFILNYRLVFAFLNAAAPFSVMILQLHGQ